MANSILDGIVTTRRNSVQEFLTQLDIDAIEHNLAPSQRSLYQALAQPRASFILECKKASPSKGLIRPDFNPVSLAQTYSRYADAISVLTEPDYFQGDYRYLAAVAAAVPQPVLCKDFIVMPEQVLLARHFGADAILLMLSVLSDSAYQQLAELAEQLKLDVLTEVATDAELERALQLNANIIGINNRNLHDLSIDAQRSITMSQRIPEGVLVVAESGYSKHQEVKEAASYVDGFLIGSALSQQKNVDQACRELIYGSHKVCGLTEPADATVVRAAGAAFGGLIFVQHSPRYVSTQQAQTIVAAEPLLNFVGVFADQPLQQVVDIASTLKLAVVQLHGQEDIDYISELRKALPGVRIWKAIGVDEPLILPQIEVDAFLLDNRFGGSGQPFDWSLLNDLSATQLEQCILAGGLSLDNLNEAQATGIQQLDVNSGVEYAKGCKDAGKIVQFFDHIRTYGKSDNQIQPDQEAVS
ncbi:bifunctional indole-3-glycerol-phosphate synthase TrpC/phosphoribosylanthranilate isomerase TrpF [Pseudidiomarina tainanensis]|uniref:bifunctional indole-3-glycerol-phosphate synthase TrpC/phosphoribosylanthranilate isomerase TrpF n=1 Tax=Pseudidiomarina tainanensis TaxID=502365 RepID=UPI0013EE9C92|nr:bifunctional indole-3-glycerol-phosphate synthase TrpC/phosphoribosylanthranilate isomerase TrpF [Pseudidiomarina tainanensis]